MEISEPGNPHFRNYEFLWWFLNISIIERWRETVLLIDCFSEPVTNLRRWWWDGRRSKPFPDHTRPATQLSSSSDLWPPTQRTGGSEQQFLREADNQPAWTPRSAGKQEVGAVRTQISEQGGAPKPVKKLVSPQSLFLFINNTAGNFLKLLKYNSFQVVPGERLGGWHNLETLTKYKFFQNFSSENFNLFIF